MELRGLLFANRGETAIRIIRAAPDLNLRAVAVFQTMIPPRCNTKMADEARSLGGRGVAVYMDVQGIIEAAKSTGCNAVHLGYGFLVEKVDL
jgi:acetyl/propionyl-CoA carboxylase alpha subunit